MSSSKLTRGHKGLRCNQRQCTLYNRFLQGTGRTLCNVTPPASLPPGNSNTGGAAPPVGVLERAPATSPPQASSAAATSSPQLSTSPAVAPLPDRTTGYLALSLVPILWGTYNPCIRYLYAEADPLDPASLTAVRTLLSAGALLLPAMLGYMYRAGRDAWAKSQGPDGSVQRGGSSADSGPSPMSVEAGGKAHRGTSLSTTLAAAADGAADGVAAAVVAEEAEGRTAGRPSGTPGRSLLAEPVNSGRLGPVLTRTFNSVVLGGLELGLLNFLGTALQVEGLHSTSATRAGFLAEVTAVLTPFVSYLAGYDIPRQMWTAVAIGLVGSTMVAYDTSQAHESNDTTPAADSLSTTEPAGSQPPDATEVSAPTLAVVPTLSTAATTPADVAAGTSSAAEPPSAPQMAPLEAAPSATALDGLEPPVAAPAATSDAALLMAAPAPALDATNGAGPVDAMPLDLALPLAEAPSVSAGLTEALAGVTGQAVNATGSDAVAVALTMPSDLGLAPFEAVVSAPALAVSAAVDAAVGAATEGGAEVAAGAASVVSAVVAEATAAAAGAAASTPLEITGGEAYLLLACLFYSVCTVRMGIYAPRMDTVELAAMKKVGLSSMSVMWMAATNLQNGAALSSVFAFPDLSSRAPISIAVLLYSGLGPGALATFLQVTGLSTVPATTAQVIYSMTPLCTAFFAYLILGGEATGPVAWAGGSLIIFAALMAANVQHNQHKQQQQRAQLAGSATEDAS